MGLDRREVDVTHHTGGKLRASRFCRGGCPLSPVYKENLVFVPYRGGGVAERAFQAEGEVREAKARQA